MWSGNDWTLVMGGAGILLVAIGNFISQMVTLRRLGAVESIAVSVAKSVDGLLEKRVAAAEDTGNLAGRHELRAEEADRRVAVVDAAAKLVADDKQIIRDDAVADAKSAAAVKAAEASPPAVDKPGPRPPKAG